MKEEARGTTPIDSTLKRIITMPTKLNSEEYLYVTEAAKIQEKSHSDFLRTSAIIEADRVFKKPTEIKGDKSMELSLEQEVLKFKLEALAKYFIAEKLTMPTDEELIKLWVEGKEEVAPFGKVKVLVVPAELPAFIKHKSTKNRS